MAPSRAEHQQRLDIVAGIASIVHARWPDARVEVYGSFSTGLYLPIRYIEPVRACFHVAYVNLVAILTWSYSASSKIQVKTCSY
jgi:hypothetical protein